VGGAWEDKYRWKRKKKKIKTAPTANPARPKKKKSGDQRLSAGDLGKESGEKRGKSKRYQRRKRSAREHGNAMWKAKRPRPAEGGSSPG